MKNGLLVVTMMLAGMTITPAHASAISFTWVTSSNQNTSLGNSATFTSGGINLTAYGLTVATTVTQLANAGPGLYAKNGGAGETGLGMTSDPGNDHEISAQADDGIQIDFSDALSKAPNATVSMTIESVQSGEGWALYGSNSLYTVAGNAKNGTTLGEPLASGVGPYTNSTLSVNLPDWGQFRYYTLMSTDPSGQYQLANILLGTVTVSTPNTPQAAPEPGTMVMAGGAFLLLGIVLRKKQAKTS